MNATPAPPRTALSAPDQDRVFAALANATRREVLRLLRDDGPQPVQRLADHFAMSRPSLNTDDFPALDGDPADATTIRLDHFLPHLPPAP
ncbi:ArsR family transcriptional regulator [Streptomyces sp. 769]|nr:ArsR family transcriptional regulator [Streptomyces sp. 769]